jgi:hypothetical protein
LHGLNVDYLGTRIVRTERRELGRGESEGKTRGNVMLKLILFCSCTCYME